MRERIVMILGSFCEAEIKDDYSFLKKKICEMTRIKKDKRSAISVTLYRRGEREDVGREDTHCRRYYYQLLKF